MISKSQEETEVFWHLEEWRLEAGVNNAGTDGTDPKVTNNSGRLSAALGLS